MTKSTMSPQDQGGQRRLPLVPENSSPAVAIAPPQQPRATTLRLPWLLKLFTRLEGTSLRHQLLVTILPVVLVPLVMAGAIGYRIISQRSTEQVQEQLQNQALLTSEGATAVLEDLLTLPQTIAASPLVVNEAQAGGAMAEAAGLAQVEVERLEDQFGETKLLRRHQRLNDYLQEAVATADIAEILITERHGFNVAYSEPTTDFVQSDEPWWQAGKNQGQWIGSPDFNFAAKGYTVELAQAIKDPSTGDFVGVIRAVLPTRKFSLLAQYVKRTGISGSQQVQLVDGATLKVIDTFSPLGFHKNRGIIGGEPVEQLIGAFVEVMPPAQDPQVVLQTLRESSPVQRLAVAFADDTATVASFSHGQRLYQVASIPNTSWVAIASMDEAEISAAGRDSLLFLVFTTVLLGAGTSALILWLARQLSAPLGSLADQTQLLAAGDFNVTVPLRGTLETRTLTQSFNQLVIQVKRLLLQQEIETQKVQLFATITSAAADSITDLEPLLDQALPQARQLLQADRVIFYPLPAIAPELQAIEAVAPTLASGLAYPHPEACIPAALLNAEPNGAPLVIDHPAAVQLNPAHQDYLTELGVKAQLAMPVFNEDELFGYLLAHRGEAQAWQLADTTFMAQLAGQLKLVIDRVTSLKNIQESRRTAEALTNENQQQTLELNRHKKQLEAQSKRLLQQNEVLLRHQEKLRQQTADQRQQKEQLQRQIALLIEDIQGVLQGDLTVQAQVAEGELKTVAEVFNLTVARLRELVGQVQQSSTQVQAILAQNEATAVQLTQAALNQAQEAAKTLNTVQPMIDSMGTIVEHAHLAAAKAKTVATTVEVGEAGMNQTVESILRLREACGSAVQQLDHLGRSSQPLGSVTAVIQELTDAIGLQLVQAKDQLSPAEASHHFDPVTQKILALTGRALEYTAPMDTCLQTLQEGTAQAAAEIGQVSAQVAETIQLVRGSQHNLEDVAVVSRQFDQLAQSISTATRSQSHISTAVTNLVKEVVGLSAQTVTFSQKMERALHETVEIAQGLNDSVRTLTVDGPSQPDSAG
jgi:methyl-accepting chemotaxis protein PixJ